MKQKLVVAAAFVVLAGCEAAPHDEQPQQPASRREPAAHDGLTPESTLAQWLAASPAERSHVAVELARERLGRDALKLDLAKAAMEITGCVTRTAGDPKLGTWKVGATAGTCLASEPDVPGR